MLRTSGSDVWLNTARDVFISEGEGGLNGCNGDQRVGITGTQTKGTEGAKEAGERLRLLGGEKRKEQRWREGKGEPNKHFPFHFSSGGLN